MDSLLPELQSVFRDEASMEACAPHLEELTTTDLHKQEKAAEREARCVGVPPPTPDKTRTHAQAHSRTRPQAPSHR